MKSDTAERWVCSQIAGMLDAATQDGWPFLDDELHPPWSSKTKQVISRAIVKIIAEMHTRGLSIGDLSDPEIHQIQRDSQERCMAVVEIDGQCRACGNPLPCPIHKETAKA